MTLVLIGILCVAACGGSAPEPRVVAAPPPARAIAGPVVPSLKVDPGEPGILDDDDTDDTDDADIDEAEPAAPTGDRDEDGLADVIDRCPDAPEDIDSFEDTDGCPDPDHDHHHAVLDVEDLIPDESIVEDGPET